jgi:hypothetical protein
MAAAARRVCLRLCMTQSGSRAILHQVPFTTTMTMPQPAVLAERLPPAAPPHSYPSGCCKASGRPTKPGTGAGNPPPSATLNPWRIFPAHACLLTTADSIRRVVGMGGARMGGGAMGGAGIPLPVGALPPAARPACEVGRTALGV